MNIQSIIWVCSRFLYILCAFIAVGLFVSLCYHSSHSAVTYAFIKTILITLFAAVLCDIPTRGSQATLQSREAIVSVGLIWLLASFFCSLPFTLSGALEHTIDSIFETISGLTSTCATILQAKQFTPDGLEVPITVTTAECIHYAFYGTVAPVLNPVTNQLLTGIEAFAPPLLFWRSLLAWIGGAGIILLIVAVLPAFGDEAKKLFRYESTGMHYSPILPRAKDTAFVLFSIYVGLTFSCLVLLLLTNPELPFFEAINLSLCTISTGGFNTKNAGIAAYHSMATEFVIIVFMLLGAINFSCHYQLLKGRLYKLKNPELIWFFVLLLVFGALVCSNLYHTRATPTDALGSTAPYSLIEAIRHGFFQVVSSITTTGFFTANYDAWPAFSQAMMVVSTVCGGMAGSTAGGLKIIRVLILWQCLRHDALNIFTRYEVRVMRLWGREIDQQTAYRVLTFFLTLVATALVGLLILLWNGVDLETSFGLSVSMINNGGAGFRMAGPLESCAFLSPASKIVCMIWMLLGRLEFYIWFALLLPAFWKNR